MLINDPKTGSLLYSYSGYKSKQARNHPLKRVNLKLRGHQPLAQPDPLHVVFFPVISIYTVADLFMDHHPSDVNREGNPVLLSDWKRQVRRLYRAAQLPQLLAKFIKATYLQVGIKLNSN